MAAGDGSLLIVEDETTLRTALARTFSPRYRVLTARDHAEALEHIASSRPERALLDLLVPGGSTVDLIRELRAARPSAHIVVMSSFESTDSLRACYEAGATRCRAKPFTTAEITACVDGSDDRAALAVPEPRVPSPNAVKRDYIRGVVAACGGNKSEAARKLGVRRQVVQYALDRVRSDDE